MWIRAVSFWLLWFVAIVRRSESKVVTVCHAQHIPIAILSKDNETGEISFVRYYDGDEVWFPEPVSGNSRRLNYEETIVTEDGFFLQPEKPSRRLLEGEMLDVMADLGADEWTNETAPVPNGTLFYARECDCFDYEQFPGDTIYCPMVARECREVVRQGGTPNATRDLSCESFPLYDSEVTVLQVILVLIFSWIIISFFMAIFTHCGRSAVSFVPAILRPDMNERTVDHLLQHRPELVTRMLETHHLYQQARIARRAERELRHRRRIRRSLSLRPEDDEIKPKSLLLRTTVWHSDKPQPIEKSLGKDSEGLSPDDLNAEIDSDAEEECTDECIICMVRLSEGTRIGSLPCRHIFHADCLKLWLRRCNACPLCKQEEVAMPQYVSGVPGVLSEALAALDPALQTPPPN